jgi:hypothetical protein
MKSLKFPILFAAVAALAANAFAVPYVGVLPPNGTVTDGPSGIILRSEDAVGSAGTGNFDPFLQIQANTTESAFNSNVANGNANMGGGHTHDLLTSSLNVVNISGTNYIEIVLDINQSGGVGSTLSLSSFQLFTHNTANLTAAQFAPMNPFATLSMSYVLTNINGGSGDSDVTFLVPYGNTVFGTYLTVFAAFSDSDDGFEEFSSRRGTGIPLQTVPDGGATLMLLGVALSGVEFLRRKARKNA